MGSNVAAAAEQAAAALLTAAAHDDDVASDLALELALGDPSHRVFTAFVVAERAYAWSPDWEPVNPVVASLMEAVHVEDSDAVGALLREQLVGVSPGAAGSFLVTLAYQVARGVPDVVTRLRTWAVQVAADPQSRGSRRVGEP